MLRHSNFGLIQMEDHLIIIDLFDARGGEIRPHHAQKGRPHVLVQPLVHGEDHVVGVELVAVVELDTLSQVQGPGQQVITGLPVLQEIGMGDVFAIGPGQVFSHLAHLVAGNGPGELGGMRDLVHRRCDAQDTAAGQFRRFGLRAAAFRGAPDKARRHSRGYAE